MEKLKKMRDMGEFVRYLKHRHMEPKTCIDVGACYGTPELFRNLTDAYHIYFEPNSAMEDRLELLTSKYHGEYHLMALGREACRMTLNLPEDAPEAAHLCSGEIASVGANVIETQVETLDRVFHGQSFTRPILLKTDCQGYDLDVFMGGVEFLKSVDVIICEAILYRDIAAEDRPVLSEIVTFLASKGFEVFDVLSYNKRPYDDSLGYVDLAFVRRDGELWSEHRWQ